MNAWLKLNGSESFVPARNEAYIGVLLDDLVTKGVDEPYRMFTSRAEYRILLRQDDADVRLTPKSHAVGLATSERLERLTEKQNEIARITAFLSEYSATPAEINSLLESLDSTPVRHKTKLIDLVARPQVSISTLANAIPSLKESLSAISSRKAEIVEAAEIQIKYKGYIERERLVADKLQRLESVKIKRNFDYSSIQSLSTEARQKLSKIRPETIGQASRIPGVSPHDINVLLILLKR